jgi:hyperosmotically inducible periplasmic protein
MMKRLSLAASCIVIGVALSPLPAAAADTTSATGTAKTYVQDSVITTKVKAELAKAKMASLVHVSVATDNQGVVTLTGTVPTQSAADRATTIAQSVEGVTSVENDLKVASAQ